MRPLVIPHSPALLRPLHHGMLLLWSQRLPVLLLLRRSIRLLLPLDPLRHHAPHE